MEKDWYNGLYIVGLKHELLTWESMGHCSALKPASTGHLRNCNIWYYPGLLWIQEWKVVGLSWKIFFKSPCIFRNIKLNYYN